jgi:hypothetical protein
VIVLLSYFVCDCSQNKTQQELIADDRIGFSRGLSELYRRALLVYLTARNRGRHKIDIICFHSALYFCLFVFVFIVLVIFHETVT